MPDSAPTTTTSPASGTSAAAVSTGDAASAPVPSVRIYDIMACNVYWDFEGTPYPREQHKFLVSFFPTPGAKTPDLIESIVAHGPDGYRVEVSNEPFGPDNRNGWIYDRTLDYYWYMVNLTTGFLAEGEYTIEVTATDGTVVSQSRTQDNGPSRAIVEAYGAHRQEMVDSFVPSRQNPVPAGAPTSDVRCSWALLRDLAGVDAYYIYRLAEGSSPREFNTQNLTWWDNIFIQAARGDAAAGLNRGEVTIGAELDRTQPYAYFVEITDANTQGGTNICIFGPHQYFAID